jgi:hypothetical protein
MKHRRRTIVSALVILISVSLARSARSEEPTPTTPESPTPSLAATTADTPSKQPFPISPVTPSSPAIALPAEDNPVPSAQPEQRGGEPIPPLSLPRETEVETAMTRAPISGSAFGGYGELTLNAPGNGTAVIDMRRLVLFFGHDFSNSIRFYSEIEVEHAIASSSDQGETEVEQAYLDGMLSCRINLRGGLILMPMGIVNVYHEPPSFNGVDRPDVDQVVIPTTWREPGVGIFGEITEGLRYQLYLVNGFNANGFTAESAIREGHQEAQLAHARDFGGILRLDYEPILGTVIGGSAYVATSGNTLRDSVGRVPVGLFDLDLRTRWHGFTARMEIALLLIGETAALNRALLAGDAEQMGAGPVSSQSRGGYAEVAYDWLHLIAPSSPQALTTFGRFDYADTQAKVVGGFVSRLEFRRYSGVFGLVWRPIPQIAIKGDYRRREFGAGAGFNEYAAAITWLF